MFGFCVNINADCSDFQPNITYPVATILRSAHIVQGYCTLLEFNCGSGECIGREQLCNGAVDCKDASDENETNCKFNQCDEYTFRCDYGACISELLTCDGKRDCADNSDENSNNCKNVLFGNASIEETEETELISGFQMISCLVREFPHSLLVFHAARPNHQLFPGDHVTEYNSILYKCRHNLLLIGHSSNLCVDGDWTYDMPVCSKYCTLNMHISVEAICSYNNQTISCEQPLIPSSVVEIFCKPGYEPVFNRFTKYSLVCREEGNWGYGYACKQSCGVIEIQLNKTNNIVAPWHVGIYKTITENNKTIGSNQHVCGGSIINAKTIVSAAHCFWNAITDDYFEKAIFLVGVGKQYRDFNAIEPFSTQMMNISKMFRQKQYTHDLGLFYSDITIIVLTDFIIFAPHIKPICLSFTLNTNTSDWMGKIFGWGIDDAMNSTLKGIELSAKNYLDCRDIMPTELNPFVSDKKFCAQGANINQGFSGGGLVYAVQQKTSKKYFLQGILSVGENKDANSNGVYSVFTNIQSYRRLMQYQMPMPNSCYIIKENWSRNKTAIIPNLHRFNEYDTVTYTCKSKSGEIMGYTSNLCSGGGWMYNTPQCKQNCLAHTLNDASVIANCEYNGRPVQCREPIMPGTIATIKCSQGYRMPNIHIYDSFVCDEEGFWNRNPYRCIQICDYKNSSSSHVDIYSNAELERRYIHVCNGNIINAKTVLTASYCFWNRNKNKYYDKSHFTIGTGKYYRRLEAVPFEPYMIGVAAFYNYSTISVAVLMKPILYDNFVKPLCLQSGTLNAGTQENTGKMAYWTKSVANDNFYLHEENLKIHHINSSVIHLSNCQHNIGSGLMLPENEKNGNTIYQLGGVLDSCHQHLKFVPIDRNNNFIKQFTEPTKLCEIGKLSNNLLAFEQYQNQTDLEANYTVTEFQSITYKCKKNYLIDGTETNVCIDGGWQYKIPECSKYCLLSNLAHFSIRLTCEYDNIVKPCTEKLLPKTIVHIICENGYRMLERSVFEVLECGADGEWDYGAFRCEQICGVAPKLIDTNNNNNGVIIPWHVSIYYFKNANYFYKCGGTIINAKTILTVANCFWNKQIRKFNTSINYLVAVGNKYNQDFTQQPSPNDIQLFNISKIFYNTENNAINRQQFSNIAIIILTNFIQFSTNISPICFDYRSVTVSYGSQGQIACWIKNNDQYVMNNEIMMVQDQCEQIVEPLVYSPFSTSNTFCANLMNETMVCNCDVGSGLVLPIFDQQRNVINFYLSGIAKPSVSTKNSQLFLNIHNFYDIIRTHISGN